jgi:hypothetical protein
MKVALCLSGQIRNWKNSFDSINKQVIEKYNCDVFIHTWDAIGNSVPHGVMSNFKFEHNKEKIDKEIIENYKPKKIKVDNTDYDFFINKTPTTRFYNTIMMWYSIYHSNNLKKEYEFERNFLYDVTIRARFDTYFEHFEIDTVNPNTIYLPPNENINNPFTTSMKNMLSKQGPSYMPNDQLAYGDTPSMDYYCSIYSIINKNLNTYVNHPEGLLSEHLWSKNKTNISPDINHNIKMKINR